MQHNAMQWALGVQWLQETVHWHITQLKYVSVNNKWSKQFDIRSHHRHRSSVQSYLPGGANVPSYEGTLAPPSEYD